MSKEKKKIFQNKTTVTHTHTQRHTKTSSSSSQRYKNNTKMLSFLHPYVAVIVDFIDAVDAFMDRNGAEFNAYVLSIMLILSLIHI